MAGVRAILPLRVYAITLCVLASGGLVSACASDAGTQDAGVDASVKVEACGKRGRPVNLTTLVQVFRARSIALSINERTCRATPKQRADGALPDASNLGPSGVEVDNVRERREGTIFCRVSDKSRGGGRVESNKFPGDVETRIGVLNVDCTLYPHSARTERVQLGRIRVAMRELVRRVS